jgi:hypothetical protein
MAKFTFEGVWKNVIRFQQIFANLRKPTISFVTSARLSARMEQLGTHWKDFHKIWYLNNFRNPVQKIQVPLKSQRTGNFTGRPTYIYNISLNYSQNQKSFRQKLQKK